MCLDVFPVFVCITQLSDFLVMSYENCKHILGVFKLWKQSYDSIFVITHTSEGPMVKQWSRPGTTFDKHQWLLL